MYDLAALKTTTDILSLIGQDTNLKKVSGDEWAGPCTFCGGEDRLRVQPSKGRWWCRQCSGQHWGSAVDYVMKRENVDLREACRRLGANDMSNFRSVPVQPQAKAPEPETPPAWVMAGLAAATDCAARLWYVTGDRARDWLHARGLRDETLQAWCIGHNPGQRCWKRPDGQLEYGRKISGLWVPSGIVIPLFAVDGALWGLNIRRLDIAGEDKYKAVKGSNKKAMIGKLTGKSTLLITEGEFDCMLAWQEAGDLVDVATFGAAKVQPADYWLPCLLKYQKVLLAYDSDKAGDEGAAAWRWFSRAERVRLPAGNDITDLWKAGGNLRAWISTAVKEPVEEIEIEEGVL